jgi:hypothetical protein
VASVDGDVSAAGAGSSAVDAASVAGVVAIAGSAAGSAAGAVVSDVAEAAAGRRNSASAGTFCFIACEISMARCLG